VWGADEKDNAYELQANLIFENVEKLAIDIIHIHRRNFLLSDAFKLSNKHHKIPHSFNYPWSTEEY